MGAGVHAGDARARGSWAREGFAMSADGGMLQGDEGEGELEERSDLYRPVIVTKVCVLL